ncbi:Uncharacterised protein [Bordetella pertussis]|nr:Uncharacterised protein [Bordetella pertussis]
MPVRPAARSASLRGTSIRLIFWLSQPGMVSPGFGLGGNSALARDSADRTSLSCAMRSLAFCTTSAWVCI